ncbi:oxygen-independent coproporphyrinogen III oxidase [Cellulosilyticum ruminicola]|uniref:hypothetical protein n=1 Tax=Cellulosilyticum ruminicola TaxID=425254 RepID=UPI0006D1B6EF|nr:hypothetical protein [Cellulosilyticum ruminicola]
MTSEQIEKLYTTITKFAHFNEDSGSSIEVCPDLEILTGDKLVLLKELGFNYISFVMQDFSQKVQKVINCSSDADTMREFATRVRELGLDLSIDLCYGLPLQGIEGFENTLKQVLEITLDKIVIYSYIGD